MTSRADIRRTMRERRRSLDANTHHFLSSETCRHISKIASFRKARSIAIYLPNDGEVDISPLADSLWKQNRRCYLPVLDRLIHRRLFFSPYNEHSVLTLNRFAIPEPSGNQHLRLRPSHLDLILMPLVAVDPAGNRVGMGGGFYDRTLSFLRTRSHWRRPILIGVAFSFQMLSKIEARPWDVPLTAIATDSGIIKPATRKEFAS